MATILRAPLYSLRWSRSYSRVPHTAQAEVWANRLNTLFSAPPAQRPFQNYDWPNPRNANTRFPIEGRTYTDPSEFWILKDKFFGGPGQPPSPTPQPNPWGAPFPIENRTHVEDLYRFAGKDQFFGAAGQCKTYDWPNPQVKPFPLENLTAVDGGLALTSVTVTAPFSQTHWPNPIPYSGTLENRTIADPSEFFGLLKDTFFGGPGQPPSPTPAASLRTAFYPNELRTWTQSHLLDTLAPVTATPFAVYDWPNPGQRTPAIENRTEAVQFKYLKDTFFGGPGQPVSPFHQPNPRGYTPASDLRTWVQSLVTNTLAPSFPPISQDDWPNPRGYAYPVSLRTAAEFTRLLGKDKIFGGPGQPITIWPQPNPLGYRYPMELRTGFGRFNLGSPIGPTAGADYIVICHGDDYIVRMASDDVVVSVPSTGNTVRMR